MISQGRDLPLENVALPFQNERDLEPRAFADPPRPSVGLPDSANKCRGLVPVEVQGITFMLKKELSFLRTSDVAGRPCLGQLAVPVALMAGRALGLASPA